MLIFMQYYFYLDCFVSKPSRLYRLESRKCGLSRLLSVHAAIVSCPHIVIIQEKVQKNN